jgi:hypothetical protein
MIVGGTKITKKFELVSRTQGVKTEGRDFSVTAATGWSQLSLVLIIMIIAIPF